MLHRTRSTPRPGYTLIELLVVIGIIALLVSLLAAAIMPALGVGSRLTAVTEMNQITASCATFKKDFGINPPSHVTDQTTGSVRLFTIPQFTDTHAAEVAIFRRMYPRWIPQTLADGRTINPPLAGAGNPLETNHAMVYFLGGPGSLLGPSAGLAPGWDPAGPYPPAAGSNSVKGPYYEFKVGKLSNIDSGVFDGQFRDPWGSPYAYFASNGDSYDPRLSYPWGEPGRPSGWTPATYISTTPKGFCHPCMRNNRWENPQTVQIISAGKNLQWGTGSPRLQISPTVLIQPFTPGVGEYVEGGFGGDDLGNFNEGKEFKVTGN